MTLLEFTRLQDDGSPLCPEHWEHPIWGVSPLREAYKWWHIRNELRRLAWLYV